MTAIAPVCPISRSQVVSGMPGIQVPRVPPAIDLPSLIQAVNALRQQLLPVGVPSPNLSLNSFNQQGAAIVAQKTNWFEVVRITEDKRIYHKDPSGKQNTSMFVDVTRINKLVFQYVYDNPYGEMFTWQYHKGAG